MIIKNRIDFIEWMDNDQDYYNLFKLEIVKYFEWNLNKYPIGEVNRKAIECFWDELISNAYDIEDIEFDIDDTEDLFSWIEENMGISYGFAQDGTALR